VGLLLYDVCCFCLYASCDVACNHVIRPLAVVFLIFSSLLTGGVVVPRPPPLFPGSKEKGAPVVGPHGFPPRGPSFPNWPI
jgi:hypothetical protein